ncbi:cytochrome-c oxidase, cbb3-type subunit III [Blastochloris viridis]|uniref:Cbb3-type cytochrome c oxidase subunit n=1 Tax=Blastochloris viridis TaxID=1079 RepID=A0A0H5BEA9_BLAVI|nr:cytochrome-c oxidase, cbb3-type subunit III [Blastochloris viridis]ALK10642.1 Cbb3-type cytochrome c oxidase subunit FixP [Blastochloris viridis]BAR99399.1 cytochrome c oxidase subunit CcoP [Blastochloris viridis]CUU43305.1 Cytochrome c oxidase subunit III [Blastochloris viridis]
MDAENKDAVHVGKGVDAITGTATTGHEWDGIQELNTPLPRWWLWIFYACIVWAFGYWVVYPAWPLISTNTKGVIGYSSRAELAADMAALAAQRGAASKALVTASLEDIQKTPELLTFALAQGKAAFGNNCAPCHGLGATGAKGYPNLNDDDWLWGGSLKDLEFTITHGIRGDSSDTRLNTMPAFGKDAILDKDQIVTLANFVLSISGQTPDAGADLASGAQLFAENCAVCHGDEGKGNPELGAPNLTDRIWLYGGDRASLVDTITNARAGVMPTWKDRLDQTTIKALAIYVHSLGGGK